MDLGPELLHALPAFMRLPGTRNPRLRRQSVEIQRDRVKVLEQFDQEERYLVICEL